MTSPLAAYDGQTLQFYADHASIYAANARSASSRTLEAFLERLPPQAWALELGCGDGRDSVAMLAQGFDVDATDGVAAMASQAESRLGQSVRVMRFDELDAERAYDAVWANASLLHVPFLALRGVLSRIVRALKPGGFHAASDKIGAEKGDERDRLGRYFNLPSAEAALLKTPLLHQAAARPFINPARNSRRSAALPPLTMTGLSAARRIGRSSRLSV